MTRALWELLWHVTKEFLESSSLGSRGFTNSGFLSFSSVSWFRVYNLYAILIYPCIMPIGFVLGALLGLEFGDHGMRV